MADAVTQAFAGVSINGSPAPVLKQRRSQRFAVSTQPAAPQPPMPSMYPHGVERSLSSDSANGGYLDQVAAVNLQQQQQLYAQQQQQSMPFTPPSSLGTPGNRASGSGIATWARSGMPPTWLGDQGPPPPMPMPQAGYPSPGYAPPVAMHQYSLPGMDFDDDELIPTALVLKNIAFSIRPEVIPTLMKDLNLPLPTAFNYHYDDGVFRGLAFANFRHPAEADAAQAALNGYELQGRRLRVEWKRMLRAGEKERIERDKAIKRMRSAVNIGVAPSPTSSPAAVPHRQPSLNGLDDGSGYEDYGSRIPSTLNFGGPVAAPPPVPPMPMAHAYAPPLSAHVGSPPSDSGRSGSSNTGGSGERPRSFHGASAPSPAPVSKYELDMNDAQTLEIYSRVLLFRDDALRDEFAFSRSLSPQQRRIVHLVAHKLGLEHGSLGEGDVRQVIVYKPGCAPPRPAPTLRHAISSIYGPDAHGGVASSPGGSPATLRGKKSLGDVRGYAAAMTNGSPLPTRKSHTDLRGGYAGGAAGSPRRPESFFAPNGMASIPPVPTLPMHAFGVIGPPSAGPSPIDAHPPHPPPPPFVLPLQQPAPSSQMESALSPSATIVRQPRGPDETTGFSIRRSPSNPHDM